jgi:hypothetical protein
MRHAEYGFETVGNAIDLELIWIMTNSPVDGAVFQFIECMAMFPRAAFGELVEMVGTRQVSDHCTNRTAVGV